MCNYDTEIETIKHFFLALPIPCHQAVFYKKVFWKFLQNLQENTGPEFIFHASL